MSQQASKGREDISSVPQCTMHTEVTTPNDSQPEHENNGVFLCPKFEKVIATDEKVTLPCQHTFRSSCIQKWINKYTPAHCLCSDCKMILHYSVCRHRLHHTEINPGTKFPEDKFEGLCHACAPIPQLQRLLEPGTETLDPSRERPGNTHAATASFGYELVRQHGDKKTLKIIQSSKATPAVKAVFQSVRGSVRLLYRELKMVLLSQAMEGKLRVLRKATRRSVGTPPGTRECGSWGSSKRTLNCRQKT
ncbi:hypothetical protein F5X99DRAFT_99137 [Biscogniauxia marginata]|nr:hypothetical protein F5X99DRAFT_99137 [Biscogniauxia marginata]